MPSPPRGLRIRYGFIIKIKSYTSRGLYAFFFFFFVPENNNNKKGQKNNIRSETICREFITNYAVSDIIRRQTKYLR